jgi:hypothetical protein
LLFDAALAVGAVAVEDAPGRIDALLVFAAGALAASLAPVGLGSSLDAVGLGCTFAAAGPAFGAGTVGLGMVVFAVALVAVLGVVGVLGADFANGLFPAAGLEREAFAVEMAAGLFVAVLALVADATFAFALPSAILGAVAAFGVLGG